MKYDFIIEPGGDPAKIIINYKGAESLQLMDGNLEIKLPGIVVKEMRPVAYQSINGRKTEIPCEFSLHGTEVSFLLPNGYDGSKELIIDPTWVFSTLTGSTARRSPAEATSSFPLLIDGRQVPCARVTARGPGTLQTLSAVEEEVLDSVGGATDALTPGGVHQDDHPDARLRGEGHLGRDPLIAPVVSKDRTTRDVAAVPEHKLGAVHRRSLGREQL